MAEIPRNIQKLLFGLGAKWHATVSMIIDSLALVAFILAIVSAATDNELGLGAGNWFLCAITLFVWGLSAWLCAYFKAKEG